MSIYGSRGRLEPVDPEICEFCGGEIDAEPQECPARGDGRRCRP